MTQDPTIESTDPNQVPLLVKGAPAQATYLAALIDSTGTVQFAVDPQGNVYSHSVVTLVGAGVGPFFSWDSVDSIPFPVEPGPGQNFSYTVPTGYRAYLQIIGWDLWTSATVADRSCHLGIFNGSVEIMRFPWSADFAAQQAGVINYYQLGVGMDSSDGVNYTVRYHPLMRKLVLSAGLTIQVIVNNIQANDHFGISWTLKEAPV